MIRYTLYVPVAYTKDGAEKTSYRRVGTVFENKRRNSDETLLNIRLDYPVGVTDLVAFPARSSKEDDPVTEE